MRESFAGAGFEFYFCKFLSREGDARKVVCTYAAIHEPPSFDLDTIFVENMKYFHRIRLDFKSF